MDAFTRVLNSSKNPVLLYKHSYRCATCLMARRTVEQLMEENAGRVEFIFIDVIQDRDLSLEIERTSSVRHESPQVILFREGVPVLDLSHGGIRYGTLKEYIENRLPE
jgi:bacillithiol system protein YtxJ